MKNLKRMIAVAMAATTAMSFAPVATAVTPVAAYAEAKIVSAHDISLVTGEEKTYTVGSLTDYADGATVSVKTSDEKIANIVKINGTATKTGERASAKGLKKADTFTVKAQKEGTVTMTVTVLVNGDVKTTEDFKVAVGAKVQSISASYEGDDKKAVDATQGIVLGTAGSSKSKEITLKSKNFDSNDWILVITGNTSNATDKIHTSKIENGATETATFTVTAGEAASSDQIIISNGTKTITIPVTVVKNAQTLTTRINGVLVEDANNDGLYDEEIYLDDQNKTASISAASDFGTGITYTSNKDLVVVDNSGNVKINGNPKDETATITIKAEATTASEKTVAVATKTVKVVVSSKALTTVTVKNSSGDVIATGRKDSAKVTGSVLLSTKDLKEDTISITSNVGDAYVITEGKDNSVFTCKNGRLTAVKAGDSKLEIIVKNSDKTTGTIKFEIPVKVVDKYAKESISTGMTSVFLNPSNPIATVSATTAHGSAVKFALVTYDEAAKEYKAYSGSDVKINAITGAVTYVNQKNSGNLYVEVSTPSHAETQKAADKVYIPLTYSSEKDVSDLKAAAVLTLKVGETGSLGATASGPITYVSSDPTIASVSADGTVTAVSAGTVLVTVKAEETTKQAAGEKIVPIVVTEKEEKVINHKPAMVKGLKISNVKGARVKVSFAAAENAVGYDVRYKVGKKTYVKRITSTSVVLKVKKGAKITVKVRSFNYKDNTTRQFGRYCAAKSLKTDKK